ncbi:MAG: 2-oxoacid:acceptor oxidoreductase family protein [Sedimentisphaerales bacterium]|nr:2-oxoacid:acceptor oxidoreductase family protein [Sedimentisphaerales bacterium]
MKTATDIYEEVIIAGFGGQGIILAGKLLAQTAMQGGFETTYMSSYGAEMRGGTANSMITVSNAPIASPVVTSPTALIVMNKASVNKFARRVKNNGLIIYNSSLIDEMPDIEESIQTVAIPADDIAVELGSVKIANMVIFGAYLQKRNILSVTQAAEALPNVLAKRYHKMLDINIQALRRGAQSAEKSG